MSADGPEQREAESANRSKTFFDELDRLERREEETLDPADVIRAMEHHAKIFKAGHEEGYAAGFLAGVEQCKVIVDTTLSHKEPPCNR